MARLFVPYAGPFSIDVDNGTVTHQIDFSLFPN
jgi:Lipocalin-like domain